MAKKTTTTESAADSQTAEQAPDVLDAVRPILTEAEQVRAKIAADRQALERQEAELAAIEARAREVATPDIRQRIIQRATIEAERTEREIADCRITLADAERRMEELEEAHTTTLARYRAKREETIKAENEARRISVECSRLSHQIRQQDARADAARARLAALTGEPGSAK